MADTLGIYLSVPFCKAKCTFCNFASDAFPPVRMDGYVDRLCREIAHAHAFAERHSLEMPPVCDSVFLGGGTPSLLTPAHIARLFDGLRQTFTIASQAEITIEAAPGQLPAATLEAFLHAGVNRISFGVQSFNDGESRAVGRLHTAQQCREEISRAQQLGLTHLNLDLIAGLPHQTPDSWRHSLQQAIATGVSHVSVYMLERDEDSRLGRELLDRNLLSLHPQSGDAGSRPLTGLNTRYGAQAVPSEDLVADLYLQACQTLEVAGFAQYEISNFARPGHQSRHNRKYWERAPYLGFGLDAHSMLPSRTGPVRFANSDGLDDYLAADGTAEDDLDRLDPLAAFEESVFLGLRLVEGLSIATLRSTHPALYVEEALERVKELSRDGLITITRDRIALTPRGRLLSSSVFGELLAQPA